MIDAGSDGRRPGVACSIEVGGASVDAVDEAVEPAEDRGEVRMQLRNVDAVLLQGHDVCGDPGQGDQKVSRQRRWFLGRLRLKRPGRLDRSVTAPW